MCSPNVPAPTYIQSNESVDSQLQAYIKNLPALVNATAGSMGVLDKAQLQTAQQSAPFWGQLQVDLANQQGVPLAEANARAEAAANAIKSEQDLATLRGAGGDLVRYADLLARSVDPEYYDTRANLARQGNALLNSYDMTGLSPTERAEMERSIARQNLATGTYGLPSQINTLANANQFGSALQNKRNNLAGSLTTVSQMTPAFRSGFDPVQTAIGRPSVATGLAGSQFAGVQQPQFGAAGLNQSNMLFGGINSTANNAMNANANMYGTFANNASYSPFDQGLKGANAAGKFAGAFMCWVAREVYGEDSMNWYKFFLWKEHDAPRWFRALYNKFGYGAAKFIKNKPLLKALIKTWMNSKI